MADLSLLISRAAGRFTADARFEGADAGAVTPDEAPAAAMPAPLDPVAEAYNAAYAEGYAAGRADALAQAAAAQVYREKLGFSFARLDVDLSETLRQRLLATVTALCEATLQPLALDMTALASRVERAAAMFARADDERVIRLHPDDLAAVQDLLPPDWTFLPDPALERGALRIETQSNGFEAGGVEDGPEQWRQAIAEALNLC